MITKTKLEELAQKYETQDFIKYDPIQFPHRFMYSRHCEGVNVLIDAEDRSCHLETEISGSENNCPPKQSSQCANLCDVEIAAFVSSLFAYGNRKIFIKKLDELFQIMQNKPYDFVLHFNPEQLKGFNYRFAKDADVIEVFRILNKLYTQDGGLRALFEHGYSIDNSIITMLKAVTDYFYSNASKNIGMGFYHLIPCAQKGGALKRMNMFLRWMVRKGPVDLGVWDFIDTRELLIPLDVHVARISREMGLLNRNSNDFKAVLELTENLRKIDPQDPAKFDFAMFGLGIDEADAKRQKPAYRLNS